MSRKSQLMQESFDALLAWLDPDRERAGQKYEIIRGGLIKIFIAKNFSDAEDLTDLTINRVISRLPDIQEDYVGDPASYFYGVARYIAYEAKRRPEIAVNVSLLSTVEVAEVSVEIECLRHCLELLPADQRDLVLEYYLQEQRQQIVYRKRLMRELNLTATALRVRAHRIRMALQKCVQQRLTKHK
jgi:DNA-directed RNA polymerase specialized sigma24 family protein